MDSKTSITPRIKMPRRKTTSGSQRGPFTVDSGGGFTLPANSSTPFLNARGHEVFTTPPLGSLPVDLDSTYLQMQKRPVPMRSGHPSASTVADGHLQGLHGESYSGDDIVGTSAKPSLLSLQMQAGKNMPGPEISARAEAEDQARAAAAAAYAQTMALMLGGEPSQYLDGPADLIRPANTFDSKSSLPMAQKDPLANPLMRPTAIAEPLLDDQLSNRGQIRADIYRPAQSSSHPAVPALMLADQKRLYDLAKNQMPQGSSVESITRKMKDMALLTSRDATFLQSALPLDDLSFPHSNFEDYSVTTEGLHDGRHGRDQRSTPARPRDVSRGRSRMLFPNDDDGSTASSSAVPLMMAEGNDRSRSLLKYKPSLDRKTSFDHTVQHSQYASRTEQSPIRRLQKKRAAPHSPVRPIDVPTVPELNENTLNFGRSDHGLRPMPGASSRGSQFHSGLSMSMPTSHAFGPRFTPLDVATPNDINHITEQQLYADYLAQTQYDNYHIGAQLTSGMNEQQLLGMLQDLEFVNANSSTGHHTPDSQFVPETVNLNQIVPALSSPHTPLAPGSVAHHLFGGGFGMTPISAPSPQLVAPWDQGSPSVESTNSISPPPPQSVPEKPIRKSAKRVEREIISEATSNIGESRSFSSPSLSELGRVVQAREATRPKDINIKRRDHATERGRQQMAQGIGTALGTRSGSRSAPNSSPIEQTFQFDAEKNDADRPESGTGDTPVQQCAHCNTTVTPLWRRNPDGNSLCNACGLFLKLHGKDRPLSLKTDKIKRRNRATGISKRHSATLMNNDTGSQYANIILDPHGPFVSEPLMMLSATEMSSGASSKSSSARPSRSPSLHSRSASNMSLSALGAGSNLLPQQYQPIRPSGPLSHGPHDSHPVFYPTHGRFNSVPTNLVSGITPISIPGPRDTRDMQNFGPQ